MKKVLLACTLALALTFAPERANAQSPLSFGAHGVYDFDLESFGIGAQLRTGLNLGGFGLVLNPNVEYFFVDDIGEIDVTHFRVNADLLYQIGSDFVQTFQPYLGAGLGIQRTSADVGDTDIDMSDTDVGLNLLAGANFGIGAPVVPFAQAGLFIGDESLVGVKVGILFGN